MSLNKLRIVFHVMGMPFDGETIKTESLGGSETAAYYQARELAKRGHHVIVFTTKNSQSISDGVTYLSMGETTEHTPLGRDFEHYARNTPHDVLIIQRHPLAFQKQFASKVNIWQTHDLALIRSATVANSMMWNVDRVTCVSQWHKDQTIKVYGFADSIIDVVPNGVDPELYEKENWIEARKSLPVALEAFLAGVRDPKFLMLYQSRPERGLEHLVRPGGIMDRLRDTNAHLMICGYDNTQGPMAQFYGQLNHWASLLPNVTNIGPLTKPQLAALQKSCDLLCYPTEFEEVSCITAMEAMHAGLPVLTTDAAALPETCSGSGTIMLPLKDGKVDEDAFVDCINGILVEEKNSEHTAQSKLARIQLEASKNRTWQSAVNKLESTIESCLAKAKPSDGALVRHLIDHSDIDAALHVGTTDDIAKHAQRELQEQYDFTKSPEAYQAHYMKHQSLYYDEFEDQVIGEDVTASTRFRGVQNFVGRAAFEGGDPKKLRVLDYGCAHGHYIMPLAKEFKHCEFVGMDISARAIKAATKWAQRDDVRNVSFVIGAESDLTSEVLCKHVYETVDQVVGGDVVPSRELVSVEKFDLIYAGEVIEHVIDWRALLEKFRTLLNPGGQLVVTTPYGRWEWSGTEAFREAREHLMHFEREDIEELCGQNKVECLYAPAGADRTGGPLGSWVWAVTPDYPFQPIDMKRKLAAQAPRQTMTACLIVKDGEKTLQKCVESFVDWVDEVVIAIDPKTRDRTRAVADQLQRDFKWRGFKIIDGLPALVDGFAAARNRTIAQASGDWILWLDADEEVQQPWNLWKYLRPSQHRAYGFPHVHYASDPPQVLTTDYPCRLFRNGEGIRFFGLVHEHPEDGPGKAIDKATIRHDVQFLHNGYVNEEVRRKRYERNLPLLTKDMTENPERKLNKFLWLRDIAQTIVFFSEQHGGMISEAQRIQAREGVKLFESLVDDAEGNTRMILDSVQFYSQCVMALGEGFDAEMNFGFIKEPFNDLACKSGLKGRFHSADCFNKLAAKLFKEGTKYYEDKYL